MDGSMDSPGSDLRHIPVFSWRHGAWHTELQRPTGGFVALCFASEAQSQRL